MKLEFTVNSKIINMKNTTIYEIQSWGVTFSLDLHNGWRTICHEKSLKSARKTVKKLKRGRIIKITKKIVE